MLSQHVKTQNWKMFFIVPNFTLPCIQELNLTIKPNHIQVEIIQHNFNLKI